MTSERQQNQNVSAEKAPLLILVGADKGGVGKTFVTRQLVELLLSRSINLRVFDTEHPDGVLTRFCKSAKIVDIEHTEGQMIVLDGLKTAAVTIIDVRAGILSDTLVALRQIGLLADVQAQKVRLVVMHLIENTDASLSECGKTAGLMLDGGDHILVKNPGKATKFQWQDGLSEKYIAAISPKSVLTIPNLDLTASEKVDELGVTFAAFAADESQS